MSSNIVHQYFKKEDKDFKILLKLNPIHLKGTEITISPNQDPELRELEFDAEIYEDLRLDGFQEVNAMEFNLYLSGLL